MSSQGDFEAFDFDKVNNQNPNMQQIMNKVDDLSIDWQNFDAPNNDKSHSRSAVSDIFNKSKKSPSQKSQKNDFEDSRDIMEISMINSQNPQGSFRFQKEDQRSYPIQNQRYSRLQHLLEAAKKNSLDQFYKNIDQQNKAYNDEPHKFSGYPQFKQYIKQLKKEKKEKQLSSIPQKPYGSIINPFEGSKSNISNPFQTGYSNNNQNKMFEPQQSNNFNFSKKNSNNNMYSSNDGFLPNQFQQQNFFEKVEEPQIQTPVAKYNNYYTGQKLPQKAPQHNKQEDAFDFFDVQSKGQSKKQKETKKNLQPIREQKHNSFERTFQEEKLQNLFKNYQNMRQNFQQLMGELKSTNEGQQRIVAQIRKIKDEKDENNIRQQIRVRSEKKQKERFEKNQKLDQIKQEIKKIKSSDKDILYTQINQKIEHLQSVVRNALEQLNQQKDKKVTPKITNYFFEQDDKFKQIDNNFEKQFNNRAQKDEYSQRSYSNKSHEQSRDLFTENIENIPSKTHIVQSPNQNSKSLKQSKAKLKSPQENSRKSFQSGSRSQNFCSPLEIHLQNSLSHQYSDQMVQQDFAPQQFAQQHFARQFQGYNKNLRNCLLQKSSVVFESFDFHVSGRFSIVQDPIHPVIAAIRIGNKCSIDLYDVHVIVYGPQGPGISTDPATIFQQEVKKNTSFAFQVSIDKTCIDDNGFSVQISYKTDSMSKKKINFKVPLPMVQLLRPQFMYQQKFLNDWYALENQMYIRPKRLDATYLRSHEDLKLIMPFIEISQQNPDSFSYGLVFRYPKSQNLYYLKVVCYVSGKASVQIRSQKQGDRKLKEQMLNVFNFILFCQ